MYGNVVKISTESSQSILSLCEVEVYADVYGKSQINEHLAFYFVKHNTKHFVANELTIISRIQHNKLDYAVKLSKNTYKSQN